MIEMTVLGICICAMVIFVIHEGITWPRHWYVKQQQSWTYPTTLSPKYLWRMFTVLGIIPVTIIFLILYLSLPS
jgi:hypothetical protein